MKAIMMILLSTFVYSQTEYLVTIPATSYTEWVYYSFETHSIVEVEDAENSLDWDIGCLLYTSPSPRDKRQSRMPSSA